MAPVLKADRHRPCRHRHWRPCCDRAHDREKLQTFRIRSCAKSKSRARDPTPCASSAQREVPMAETVNRQILLKSRPDGRPTPGNFELAQGRVPRARRRRGADAHRLPSVDPYMRGRMSAAKSYAKPAAIGEPMVGGTIGDVVTSRDPKISRRATSCWAMAAGRTMRSRTARACASSIRRRLRSRPRSACSECPA